MYLRKILEYPLPNKHCVQGVRLQNDIVLVLKHFVGKFSLKIKHIKDIQTTGVYGQVILKFFECAKLIRENPLFNRSHINIVEYLQEIMMDRIKTVTKKFADLL